MKNLKLHQKVQLALMLLSLIPLLIMAINSIHTLRTSEAFLLEQATETIDLQVEKNLILRADMVAKKVSDFLDSVVGDLYDLRSMEPVPETYKSFYLSHQREIWFRGGTNSNVIEKHELHPLYSELAFIDPDGNELVRIFDGEVVRELRNVMEPKNTTYKTEDYFEQTIKLQPGEVYVSRLTGWHILKDEQLAGAKTATEAIEGKRYEGVIRFALSVHNEDGSLAGVVVLSLDHRHLMEFTQHVDSTAREDVVFPSYESGNYAFMFDDEGWMITHPKYWDIRGLDRTGNLVPPYTDSSTVEDVETGRIPFNLNQADFIHVNYPVVAIAVREHQTGIVDVTNVGGSRKIMAYAPIEFPKGLYRDSGVFGGVTIGAELSYFHKPALEASKVIKREFTQYVGKTWLIILLTGTLVFFTAWWLSISITRPVLRLIEGTKKMASGQQDVRVEVTSNDEVGELAISFNTMVEQLGKRSNRLVSTLEDLRRSRQEILRERNFKETIVEHIETGLLTLNDEGEVSTINSPARNILGVPSAWKSGTMHDLFKGWPEIFAALDEGMAALRNDWNRYVEVEREGRMLTLRIAIIPIEGRRHKGHMITIEDLTERVNLRKMVERMERLAALGKFSAGIAHEVRNPLTGISLLLDELHDRMLQFPNDQILIRKALAEIERLEELVNSLLNYATSSVKRMEKGKLNSLIDESLFMITRQCEQSGIKVSQIRGGDVPELVFDASKLKQALINIYTNALEAMSEGGELVVEMCEKNAGVQLKITDTGIGIKKERLPLIFEPFYTSRGEGTGLGLSITHNIIAEHGGNISVESTEGEGTVFTIWLPKDRI